MTTSITGPIRIGTRGSQLALWQANHIAARLREAGQFVAIEVIRTTGDRLQQPDPTTPASAAPASQLPAPLDTKGIFIKEIEDALAANRIDLAVHSLKDLPTQLDPRFTLAAIPERADARDVFVCGPYWALHTLPMGASVGTTSPRRRAQLLALRPDLRFVDLDGNIDTRLRKLERGDCDALVLAAAGLDRLGRTEWVHQRFAFDELCPAPGQGALALQMRAKPSPYDTREQFLRRAVLTLDHVPTRFAVEAERTALDALGGGCQLPIGIHCQPIFDGELIRLHRVHAQVLAPDGESMVSLAADIPAGLSPTTLGLQIANDLKARGALALLEQIS